MDKKEFQDAFSVVRASDEFRLEVLQMTQMKKRTAGVMRKVLIAAAIIALLATTALAAPPVIRYFTGGRLILDDGTGGETIPPENAGQALYQLELEFEVNPDVSEYLEEFYMFTLDSRFNYFIGEKSAYTVDGEERVECVMYEWLQDNDDPTQWASIHLTQQSAYHYDGSWSPGYLSAETDMEPQVNPTELGGVAGYLVEQTLGTACRMFIWCDGDSIFVLTVPTNFNNEEIADFLESMTKIGNLDEYIGERLLEP